MYSSEQLLRSKDSVRDIEMYSATGSDSVFVLGVAPTQCKQSDRGHPLL